MVTMLGWLSDDAVLASCWKRRRRSGSSIRLIGMILRATRRPRRVSPGAGPAPPPLGVVHPAHWHDFEGHQAAETSVPGSVHLAHTAGADGCLNFVGAELIAH